MRALKQPLALPIALAAMTGGVAAVPSATIAQTASQAGAGVVQLNTGRGRLVTLAAPMSDLFVADEKIADVQVRSPTQLYIFGKAPGETTVSATSRSGKVVYSSTIRVGNNFDSIGAMLNLAMPDAQIVATPMNGLVLLTGVVAQPADAAEAERLVQAFVGEQTKVLSRLKTATPLQVNLQVRFAEVSRSFIKNIGVNLANRDSGSFLFGIAQGSGGPGSVSIAPGIINPPAGTPITVDANGARPGSTVYTFPNAPAGGGTALTAAGRLLGTSLLASLDLGETIGQVSTLANPNLTALSGETGTFLAGGEIPIPIAQALGAVSVEYKQYGVSIAYTPTVLADGRISLRVRPEVSQLSAAGAVNFGGTQIPALTTRRAETTVELGSGQSLVIGGLIQNSHDNQVTKAPGLGDLPILGALFRSNGFQRNETELMIVITPYLVKPVNANEIVLPTDGYQAPTDAERILLGKLSGGQTGARRPMPQMAAPGATPTIGATSPAPVDGPAAPIAAAPVRSSEPPRKSKGDRDAAPGFSPR